MKLNEKLFEKQTYTNIANDLINLQPKEPKFTTLQLIQELKPQIKLAFEKGYTQNEIIDILKSHGINISLQTFKNYLNQKKGKDKTRAAQSKNFKTNALEINSTTRTLEDN